MPAITPHALSFWVRWAHTVSMGVLLGGTLLMWVDALEWLDSDAPAWAGQRAERFELLFWLALGVQIMTGIGNLGAFGAALPAPISAWGGKLLLKLALVLGLLLLSLLRTVVVARLRAAGPAAPPPSRRLGSNLYGLTTVVLAAIIYLAVSLAHG